jgi:Ca2+/Na+ antiporter
MLDSVMGMAFLAAGTSLPEAVSSVIVTCQGYGSMGVSNSIGSNIFDILLCLGLPWLIKTLIAPVVTQQPMAMVK